MVKAYLRYVFDNLYGTYTGNDCNIIYQSNIIYASSGQFVIVLNIKTGEIINQIKPPQDKNIEITALAIYQELLAIGFKDGDILLFDLQSNKPRTFLIGHKSQINTIKFNSNGFALFSGSADNTIIKWDIIGEDQQLKMIGHANQITQLEIIQPDLKPQEFIISSSKDGLIKLWDIQFEQSIKTISSNHSQVNCFTLIHKYSILLICTNSDEILIKSLPDFEDEGIFKRQSFANPQQIIFDSQRQQIFILTSDQKIELYKIKKKALRKAQKGEKIKFSDMLSYVSILTLPSKVKWIELIHKGFKVEEIQTLLAISFTNNTLEVRQVNEQGVWVEEQDQPFSYKVQGNSGGVKHLELSENDDMLISIAGKESKIFDGYNGKIIKSFQNSNGYNVGCFLPKSKYILLGDNTGVIELVDLQTSEILQNVQGHQAGILSIKHSEKLKGWKGLVIVTAGRDRWIKFWELFLNKKTKLLELVDSKSIFMKEDLNSLELLSNGLYYGVAMQNNNIQLYYCDSHHLYLELYGHSLPVLSFSITSDSYLLISGGQDKNIKIWGMDFGDCKKTIKSHREAITSIRTVNETHYFMSGSRDKTLKYWDGDTYQLILQFDEMIYDVLSIAIGVIGDVLYVGNSQRQILKYIQTKDQVFIQEEEEKRVDNILLSNYEKEQNRMVDENNELEQGDQVLKHKTLEKLKIQELRNSEDLMESLEKIKKFRYEMEEELNEDEIHDKKIWFNYEEPQHYLMKNLSRISISSLGGILKFMHIQYLSTLINELKHEDVIQQNPQLCSNIINYLIMHHEGQLITSLEMIDNLLQLKNMLKSVLYQQKHVAELNLVAIEQILQNMEDEWEFV